MLVPFPAEQLHPPRSPRGTVLACIHLASSAPSQVPRPAPTVLTPELASPSTQTTPRCGPPRHAHGTTLPSPRAALPHSRAGPPPRCPGTVLPSTTPTLPCVPRTAAPRSRSSSSALPCSPLTVSPRSHRNCPPSVRAASSCLPRHTGVRPCEFLTPVSFLLPSPADGDHKLCPRHP